MVLTNYRGVTVTKDELLEWIEEADAVEWYEEFDSSGNHEQWNIYAYKGKYFVVYFTNGHPCEKWGDRGYVRGEYEPMEVFLKTETITREYFVHECGNEAGWYR